MNTSFCLTTLLGSWLLTRRVSLLVLGCLWSLNLLRGSGFKSSEGLTLGSIGLKEPFFTFQLDREAGALPVTGWWSRGRRWTSSGASWWGGRSLQRHWALNWTHQFWQHVRGWGHHRGLGHGQWWPGDCLRLDHSWWQGRVRPWQGRGVISFLRTRLLGGADPQPGLLAVRLSSSSSSMSPIFVTLYDRSCSS